MPPWHAPIGPSPAPKLGSASAIRWPMISTGTRIRQALGETRSLPATLAAAIALEAWNAIDPLQHQPWLGRLLVASLLRQRGKTSHLACLNVGLRLVPRERRRAREATPRLVATLEAIAAMAEASLKDHDRWLTARSLLARKLERRRSTSSLPALVDYVMSRPRSRPA